MFLKVKYCVARAQKEVKFPSSVKAWLGLNVKYRLVTPYQPGGHMLENQKYCLGGGKERGGKDSEWTQEEMGF